MCSLLKPPPKPTNNFAFLGLLGDPVVNRMKWYKVLFVTPHVNGNQRLLFATS
jgi:hypothetical protein